MAYKLSLAEHDIAIFFVNKNTSSTIKSVYRNDFYWSDKPTDKISATPTERWKKTFILSEFA